MASILPPPPPLLQLQLLLLLLLASGPGGAVGDGAVDREVFAGAVGEITRSNSTDGRKASANVFVLEGTDFKGVVVRAAGVDSQHAAWFPAQDTCFPRDDRWRQFQPWAMISDDNATVALGYKVGACQVQCVVQNRLSTLQRLTLEANGPSKWILKAPPSHYDIVYVTSSASRPSDTPPCQSPPSPSSTLPDTDNDTGGAGDVPVAAGVLAAALVLCQAARRV